MHPSLPKTYPYYPKASTSILCILFFGACAAVLGWKASTNDRGLVLNGIITLSQEGASGFYWILCALSVGFVLLGVLLAVQWLAGSVVLEITASAVRIPHGFIRKRITEVGLEEVTDITETEIQGQRFLYLHASGKRHCINRALMPSAEAYEEARELIASATAALKPGDGGR